MDLLHKSIFFTDFKADSLMIILAEKRPSLILIACVHKGLSCVLHYFYSITFFTPNLLILSKKDEKHYKMNLYSLTSEVCS